MKLIAIMLAGAAMIAATGVSAQTVAYTNGPINGRVGANTINNTYEVTDSFHLGSATTLTGFSFGGWTSPGDTISSVTYGFSSAPDYATTGNAILAAGSASQSYGYDVRNYDALIAPVTLAAGDYYFSLQNAVTTDGNPTYWDINYGPSTAYQYSTTYGNQGQVSSHAFTLFGTAPATTGAVPEPATWAMMMLGFGMIGFGLRRRSKVTTSVSFA